MRLIVVALAAASLSGCVAQSDAMVEAGFPRGSLAVAAIDRGDYDRAEQLLLNSSLGTGNPALLINLGYVYSQQGRTEEAVSAWQRALEARRWRRVVTADGREVRTDLLARQILASRGQDAAPVR